MKNTTTKKLKIKKTSVVFVCTGNICRSPVAERLFKHHVKGLGFGANFKISSVGLAAQNGDAMTGLSQDVLKQNKVNANNHKSRMLTDKIIKNTDYFICMTAEHKFYMRGVANTYTVAEITSGLDVVDPWGGSMADYSKMYDYLAYAAPEIYNFIKNKESNKQQNKEVILNDSNS